MFLEEALQRCSQLLMETAALFDALAARSPDDAAAVRRWKGAAARERRRAAFLSALASLCSALEDEGPFLVQIPPQLDAFRRALESANWRHSSCDDHSPCACVESLDTLPRASLYADLLEIAEPELRRALRMVGTEIRNHRSARDSQRSRSDARPLAWSAA